MSPSALFISNLKLGTHIGPLTVIRLWSIEPSMTAAPLTSDDFGAVFGSVQATLKACLIGCGLSLFRASAAAANLASSVAALTIAGLVQCLSGAAVMITHVQKQKARKV